MVVSAPATHVVVVSLGESGEEVTQGSTLRHNGREAA